MAIDKNGDLFNNQKMIGDSSLSNYEMYARKVPGINLRNFRKGHTEIVENIMLHTEI
jgi:hypothetical protein